MKRKGAVTKAPGRPEGRALLAAVMKVAAAAASTRLAVSAWRKATASTAVVAHKLR